MGENVAATTLASLWKIGSGRRSYDHNDYDEEDGQDSIESDQPASAFQRHSASARGRVGATSESPRTAPTNSGLVNIGRLLGAPTTRSAIARSHPSATDSCIHDLGCGPSVRECPFQAGSVVVLNLGRIDINISGDRKQLCVHLADRIQISTLVHVQA